MQSHWIMLLPQIYKFTITLYTTIGTASTVSDAWGPQLDSRQTDKPKCHIERGRERRILFLYLSRSAEWVTAIERRTEEAVHKWHQLDIWNFGSLTIASTAFTQSPFGHDMGIPPSLPLLMSFVQGPIEGMAEGALSPLRLEEGIRSMDWMVWQDWRRRSCCMIPAARNWAYLQNWLMLLSHSTPKYTNLWLML